MRGGGWREEERTHGVARGGKVYEEDASCKNTLCATHTYVRVYACARTGARPVVRACVRVCTTVRWQRPFAFRMQRREASNRVAFEERTAKGEGGKREGGEDGGEDDERAARPPEVSASRAQATRLAPKGGEVLDP